MKCLIDVDETKKKWKYLTDYYTRIKKKPPSGDEARENEWPYKKSMSFLDSAAEGSKRL